MKTTLPSHVTVSTSFFDKDQMRQVIDPPQYLLAMRKKYGAPAIRDYPEARSYSWCTGFDRCVVTVWKIKA